MTRSLQKYLAGIAGGGPPRVVATADEARMYARDLAVHESNSRRRAHISFPDGIVVFRSAESYANALFVYEQRVRDVFVHAFVATVRSTRHS